MSSVRLSNEILNEISDALNLAINGKASFTNILPYKETTGREELEAVLFLKPEITSNISIDNFKKLLPLILDNIYKWDLNIESCLIMGAEYLEKYEIISNHYGVINKISRLGFNALSDDAKINLNQKFKGEISLNADVIGGHQFLSRFQDISPKSLDVLVSNLGVTKLAPGTYCTKIKLDGDLFLVLNGFHPHQIEHFTKKGRAIVVFLLRGGGDWKTLRDKFLGATNPMNAMDGSIRKILLTDKDQFGIKQIDQGNNGVHFSAGPLEGMVETIRYFSNYQSTDVLDASKTTFGGLLIRHGYESQDIKRLMANPTLQHEDKRISAFDLTEEKQPDIAVQLLKKSTIE